MNKYLKQVVSVLLCTFVLAGSLSPVVAAESQHTPSFDDNGVMTKESHQFYIDELNTIRATKRAPITSSKNIKDDGNPLPPLKVTEAMNKWALTRAQELAELGDISHDNTYNGAPDPSYKDTAANLLRHPNYVGGTYVSGPENLAWSAGQFSDPVLDWDSEKVTGEQDYGHYLTNVSPYANIVGFASVRVPSKKLGDTVYEYYSVLVIAYDENVEIEQPEDLTPLKNAAVKELEDKANARKAEMDALSNISADNLKASKDAVDKALQNAKDVVNAADSEDAINAAKTAGLKAISDVPNPKETETPTDLTQAKEAAVKELEDKATARKAEMDALNNISADDLKASKDAVDKALQNAKDAVSTADTEDAINAAKTAGLKAISDVPNPKETETPTDLTQAKEAGVKELEDKANARKAEMDALSNVSADNLKASKDAVDKALQNAKDAVNAADSEDAINAAKNAGLKAISDVPNPKETETPTDLTQAKEAAVKELEDKATARKAEMDALNNISADDLKASKDAVDKALQDAKDAVNAADSEEAINTAKTAGLKAISDVADPKVISDSKPIENKPATKLPVDVKPSDTTTDAKTKLPSTGIDNNINGAIFVLLGSLILVGAYNIKNRKDKIN